MLAVLAARDVKTSMKEEFYGVEYALTYTEPALVKKWRNAKTRTALKLPESNIFLPESLDILSYKGRIKLTHQTLKGLEQERLSLGLLKRIELSKGKYWSSLFQQDFRFETPKAHLTFRINTSQVYSSPRNAVLSQLYTDAISEGLNEFGYPVRLAGLEYGINVDKKGIILTFSGYSDRILELIKKVSGRLKEITIDKKTFNTLKEVRARRYQNFHFQQPFQQAFYYRSLLLEGRKFSIMDYEKAIKKISLNDVKKFADKIYDRIYIDGLAYGNLRQEPVMEAAKVLRQKLAGKPLPEPERFRESVIQVPSGKSHVFTRKMQVENSAVVLETQIGQLSPELQGALLVIDNLIQPQFYNELRTSQQLGYIVNSGMTLLEKTLGLIFMVQSGEYDAEILEKRIDVFLLKFFESLKELPEAEFTKIKKSVLHSKLQKSTSVSGEAERLFTIAFERNAEFDLNSESIKAIEQLKMEDILQAVDSYLLPSRQRRLILRMSGKNHLEGVSEGEPIVSIAEFKQLYSCPENCLP